MKKIVSILTLIGLFCILAGVGFYLIKGRDEKIIHTDEENDKLALQEVSRRTGIEFNDWISLREYVFCDLLKMGMTKEEVENTLSKVGEIRVYDDSIEFKNKYLYRNIPNIIVDYDVGGPTGKLIYLGRRSATNSDTPSVGCEIQK
jgi:hypothetical protein